MKHFNKLTLFALLVCFFSFGSSLIGEIVSGIKLVKKICDKEVCKVKAPWSFVVDGYCCVTDSLDCCIGPRWIGIAVIVGCLASAAALCTLFGCLICRSKTARPQFVVLQNVPPHQQQQPGAPLGATQQQQYAYAAGGPGLPTA